MRKAMMFLTASVLCIPALAACSSDPEPVSTVAVTSDDHVPEYDIETETETGSSTFDEDISSLALEITWEELTSTEQDSICDGWALDRSGMTDIFMESSDNEFARSDVTTFFDAACA